MKKILILLVLAFSWAFASKQAMLILDASGSMWGQIDGKEKIVIAKEAVYKVIKDWDESIHVGLMVYGHRKKGDCEDIEVLMPTGKIDKAILKQKVSQISPKGKTPISKSLQKAAKILRFTEDEATIILISDGKETCDSDPCEVAKELEKLGINFTAHVIGFNVDANTDKQLSCIAKATGGKYFSAKNPKDLNNALKKLVKEVKKPKTTLKISVRESQENKNSQGLQLDI
ncbi:MAG: hypothetical protein CR967_03300 [Proteobacteria bacterium]|nr:MAG: hypothetical protein CR967_03300 [Pseudomonadota bacterium]